ncbi:MAG: GAF domain-containing SpoIIE family protein phosphatase [Peptostreptococcaceae bacterium]
MTTENRESNKMKSLVEISTMVTKSLDFFNIKDQIIEKMLEVVHPTKACVNLFYKSNYDYAYLVCSQTLEIIPQLFPINSARGVKIDFKEYPKYVHQSVKENKIIYIENIFEDERAIDERELAKEEGYRGRIVFPLSVGESVVGFMTCFLTEEDYVSDEDIDFIASVSSLLSLSIEMTMKNSNTQMLVHKLRGGIASINEATKKLYLNRNIGEFLEHLSKQACEITSSRESIIVIDQHDKNNKVLKFYSSEGKNQANIYPIIDEIMENQSMGAYFNDAKLKDKKQINGYIYYKLKNKDGIIGCIACANSQHYTEDDLNILSILAKQLSVAMQLYQYNLVDVKHQVLANELNILNKQQKLIMNESNMDCNEEKELSYYHKPAKVVGGDFYYAMKVDEEHIVYIVADVMGHGIVSNYVVAMIKGAFKVLSYQYKKPSEILTNLNRILYDEFDKMGVFTTCLINMVNIKNNTITISNGGHYSPIMIKNDGSVATDLNCKKGIPIGIMRDAEYQDNMFNTNEYSMVCMYTDGVLEIKNKGKEEYGTVRLENFVQRNYKLKKESIIENLRIELEEFSEKENFDDDILMVMLKNK